MESHRFTHPCPLQTPHSHLHPAQKHKQPRNVPCTQGQRKANTLQLLPSNDQSIYRKLCLAPHHSQAGLHMPRYKDSREW